MFQQLEDFKTAELPERKLSFWKMAGPGAILVGLSIGAGEIAQVRHGLAFHDHEAVEIRVGDGVVRPLKIRRVIVGA